MTQPSLNLYSPMAKYAEGDFVTITQLEFDTMIDRSCEPAMVRKMLERGKTVHISGVRLRYSDEAFSLAN